MGNAQLVRVVCPLCCVNTEAVHCVVVSMQRLSDVMHLDMIMDKSAEEIMKVRMCVCAYVGRCYHGCV